MAEDNTTPSSLDTASLHFRRSWLPEWDTFRASMEGIFSRQYYTNHGPLARQLERSLETKLHVSHAVAVTNATIGLAMAIDALKLQGSIIGPAFSSTGLAQACTWTGLQPVYADLSPTTAQVCVQDLKSKLNDNASAIIAASLWGGCAPLQELHDLAQHNQLRIIGDFSQGAALHHLTAQTFKLCDISICSIPFSSPLTANQGAVLFTNDEDTAKRLRNIRSSYGAGPAVPVMRTANGRMSEAQAALALIELDCLGDLVDHNNSLQQTYQEQLNAIPGIQVLFSSPDDPGHHHVTLCEVDDSVFGTGRRELVTILNRSFPVAFSLTSDLGPEIHKPPEIIASLEVTRHLLDSCFCIINNDSISQNQAMEFIDVIRNAHGSAATPEVGDV